MAEEQAEGEEGEVEAGVKWRAAEFVRSQERQKR